MAAVKRRNTGPELTVRRLLHAMGYRFRIDVRKLPGSPDIVLPKRRTVLFVHGCFWHGHEGCRKATIPKTNTDFWLRKIERNKERDRQVTDRLIDLGWRVEVAWQCELRHMDTLTARLHNVLKGR